MIKILVERQVKKSNYSRLIDHLVQLRAAALHQPGYVSGETLVKENGTIDVITISTWISEDHWKAWLTSETRTEINNIINQLIEGEASIKVYKMHFEEE